MVQLLTATARLEDPPDFWFVVIPEEVYELGRPLSRVLAKERIQGEVQITKDEARKLEAEPTLFGLEEAEADIYRYATHFRRQLKARLLADKVVTQIVRETTLAPNDFLRSDRRPKRRLEDPATVAWKLSTGAYYKAGGRPWQLADVRPGVCYVGLAYKRREASPDDRFACCAAQMFLSSGEGVVFRGALGPPTPRATCSARHMTSGRMAPAARCLRSPAAASPSSPARRESRTAMARAFRRWPSNTAASTPRQKRWAIPACGHCKKAILEFCEPDEAAEHDSKRERDQSGQLD